MSGDTVLVEAPQTPSPLARKLFLPLVGAYAAASAALSLAVAGNAAFLQPGFVVLTVLVIAVVNLGAFARDRPSRQFYLAMGILCVTTFAQAVLTSALPTFSASIITYLILGGSLLFYQWATQARVAIRRLHGAELEQTLLAAVVLGVGFAVVESLLPSRRSSAATEGLLAAILVAATLALLDEYWFRGILQSRLATASSARGAWLAGVVLFAAFGAPGSDPAYLAFRAGLGLTLGYVVYRFRWLPMALLIRTLAAGLAPALAVIATART